MIKEFEVGDVWINEHGAEIKIVYIGKNEVVGKVLEIETENLLVYDKFGNVPDNGNGTLVKKKPKTSKLKVKGFIPVYKDHNDRLSTWFMQMASDEKIAEEFLTNERRLGTTSFGAAFGRFDAWKVIPYEFEIEVELDG